MMAPTHVERRGVQNSLMWKRHWAAGRRLHAEWFRVDAAAQLAIDRLVEM